MSVACVPEAKSEKLESITHLCSFEFIGVWVVMCFSQQHMMLYVETGQCMLNWAVTKTRTGLGLEMDWKIVTMISRH